MLPTGNVTHRRSCPILGFPDVTMDTETPSGHMTCANDSAHEALSNGPNIKSMVQLVAELLQSKPGSAA